MTSTGKDNEIVTSTWRFVDLWLFCHYPTMSNTRLLCTPLNKKQGIKLRFTVYIYVQALSIITSNIVIATFSFAKDCTCCTLFSPLIQQSISECVYFDWSVSRIVLNREIRFMTSWYNFLPHLLNEKYENIRQTLPQQFFCFDHTCLPFSWYFLTLQLRPNNLFKSVDKLSLTQR